MRGGLGTDYVSTFLLHCQTEAIKDDDMGDKIQPQSQELGEYDYVTIFQFLHKMEVIKLDMDDKTNTSRRSQENTAT